MKNVNDKRNKYDAMILSFLYLVISINFNIIILYVLNYWYEYEYGYEQGCKGGLGRVR